MHADNHATDAQHDAADAALVRIMRDKINSTEWGHDLTRAAAIECVYAPWFRDIAYTGTDDRYAGMTLRIEDPHGDGWKRHHVTRHDIANAIAEIWNGQHGNGYVAEYVRDAINDHDAGHIDADAADAIIQVAALGEITYG